MRKKKKFVKQFLFKTETKSDRNDVNHIANARTYLCLCAHIGIDILLSVVLIQYHSGYEQNQQNTCKL